MHSVGSKNLALKPKIWLQWVWENITSACPPIDYSTHVCEDAEEPVCIDEDGDGENDNPEPSPDRQEMEPLGLGIIIQ